MTVVDPAFAAVAGVFAEVVPADGPGAAFAAYVDGTTVVDLWGGTRDEAGRPWERDTTCVVFSGTKGAVATAMLTLIEADDLDRDDLVAQWWPEFAAEGKEPVTLADVLGHAAGLPGFAEPVSAALALDPVAIEDVIARQAPIVPIGEVSYHALTFGWLCDALARRIDGRSIGRVFAEDVARPLGLDLHIGAPEAAIDRVAEIVRSADFRLAALLGDREPDPRLALVYGNPSLEELALGSPATLRVEVPGANGVGTARALARLYGCLASGGALGGTRILAASTVAEGRAELRSGDDVLSQRPLRFGSGFELQGTPSCLGPAPDAFGHTGSGGSSHGAWPSLRTGFSFTMRELRPEDRDERARRLLEALHDALE